MSKFTVGTHTTADQLEPNQPPSTRISTLEIQTTEGQPFHSYGSLSQLAAMTVLKNAIPYTPETLTVGARDAVCHTVRTTPGFQDWQEQFQFHQTTHVSGVDMRGLPSQTPTASINGPDVWSLKEMCEAEKRLAACELGTTRLVLSRDSAVSLANSLARLRGFDQYLRNRELNGFKHLFLSLAAHFHQENDQRPYSGSSLPAGFSKLLDQVIESKEIEKMKMFLSIGLLPTAKGFAALSRLPSHHYFLTQSIIHLQKLASSTEPGTEFAKRLTSGLEVLSKQQRSRVNQNFKESFRKALSVLGFVSMFALPIAGIALGFALQVIYLGLSLGFLSPFILAAAQYFYVRESGNLSLKKKLTYLAAVGVAGLCGPIVTMCCIGGFVASFAGLALYLSNVNPSLEWRLEQRYSKSNQSRLQTALDYLKPPQRQASPRQTH